MSLLIASLNSGSNGNCYYVGNEREAVLVDIGISCRETERRMAQLGLSPEHVKAIFISHEHSDHIRGVAVFSRKYRIPVYITPRTLAAGRLDLLPSLVVPFVDGEVITIGGLTVTAFHKIHDAIDPHSFTVSGNDTTIGILTDIGAVCDNVAHYFGLCDAVFLETNYDSELLHNGRYPWHLKNRIRGGKGHLSNDQALELFCERRAASLTHVLLSHLSSDNNRPELVHELFSRHAGSVHVSVASRHEASEVFRITGKGIATGELLAAKRRSQLQVFAAGKKTRNQAASVTTQLSLFD